MEDKRERGVLCEVKVVDRDRTTDWLLRSLEGKWLIESDMPRLTGAKYGDSVDEVMKYAIDYHQDLEPPE